MSASFEGPNLEGEPEPRKSRQTSRRLALANEANLLAYVNKVEVSGIEHADANRSTLNI